MKTNPTTLLLLLAISLFGCQSKSELIIDFAGKTTNTTPVKKSSEIGNTYEYYYEDSVSFRSEQDYITICDKIDAITNSMPTDIEDNVPVYSRSAPDELTGYFIIKTWDVPKYRLIAAKFRGKETYKTHIDIITKEK